MVSLHDYNGALLTAVQYCVQMYTTDSYYLNQVFFQTPSILQFGVSLQWAFFSGKNVQRTVTSCLEAVCAFLSSGEEKNHNDVA